MRQILYLTMQHMKRRRFRTGVMIVSIAVAVATMFMAIMISQGIRNTLDTARHRLGADIVVVPEASADEAESALISGNPTAFYMQASVEDQVRAVTGVAQISPQVFLRSLDAPCCVARVALVGYDPDRDFTISHWSLKHNPGPLRDDQIIVGAKVISAVVGAPEQAIGQRLIFMGKPFSVAMILEPTGLGTDYTVFVTLDTAYRMTRDSPLYPVPVEADQISTILIRVADQDDPAEVAARIESALPELRALTAGSLTRSVSWQLERLADILYLAGGVFSVLAILLAGSLFMLSVRQRTRELGLFMAMGAGHGLIARLILLEAGCIAGLGAFAGVAAGAAVMVGARDFVSGLMGSAYMWPGVAAFAAAGTACVGAAMVTGMLGGLYPARRIGMMEPYQAIRLGERAA